MYKKILRITVLTLSVIFICSVFTGCDELDKLKLSYAVIDGDNITLNGDTYIPVPEEKLNNRPEFDPYFLEDMQVYACESDVPLLLADVFCTYQGYVTKDKTIVCLYEDESIGIYCREDKYDSLLESLDREFSAEKYAYKYSYYDHEQMLYVKKIYTLTDEQLNSLNEIISTVHPEYEEFSSDFEADSYAEICGCSADMLMVKSYCTLAYSYSGYSIRLITEDGIEVYDAPAEYDPILSDIMKMRFYADNIYTDFEYDE